MNRTGRIPTYKPMTIANDTLRLYEPSTLLDIHALAGAVS